MPTVSHAPLDEQMLELFERGEPVILAPYTNVAPGSGGGAVMALVRRGLWELQHRHIGNDAWSSWERYGPKAY